MAKVNTKKIFLSLSRLGEGLYDMMSEDHKTAVAFGMIPHEIIVNTMVMVKARIAEVYAESLGIPAKDIRPHIKKEFLNEVEHEICLGIYSRASDLGRMIV